MRISNNEEWPKQWKWSGRVVPIWVSSHHSARKVFIRHMIADRQSWLLAGVLPNGYSNPQYFCYAFGCHDPPIMVSPSAWGLEVLWSLYHRMFIGWSTVTRLQCGRTSSSIYQCCPRWGSSFYMRYKCCLILALANNFLTLFNCFDFDRFDRERKVK